jgi:Rrf2 family protein
MRLSSLADYAVVMMGAAARHCGGQRTSATELAAETGIPLPTAQKLVSLLTRAGLLKSVRGQGGGIKLARPSLRRSALPTSSKRSRGRLP